jgi:hypothetical protein
MVASQQQQWTNESTENDKNAQNGFGKDARVISSIEKEVQLSSKRTKEVPEPGDAIVFGQSEW